jgi:arginase
MNEQLQPGTGKTVGIVGVPLAFGQGMLGVELGPSAIRVAGLASAIASLGYEVNDRGDLRVDRPRTYPREGEKLKYLNEVFATCSALAIEAENHRRCGRNPVDAWWRSLDRRLDRCRELPKRIANMIKRWG